MRRAGAFACVGSFAFVTPVLQGSVLSTVPPALAPIARQAPALPFALIALVAISITDGPLFELFARPEDRQEGRLRGLFGFALSAAILALLVALEPGLPVAIFVATVLLVAIGNLGAEVALTVDRVPTTHHGGFAIGGVVGGLLGFLGTAFITAETLAPALVIVLVAVGTLSGGLVRSMLFPRDEPPIIFSVALLLWLCAAIGVGPDFGVLQAVVAVAIPLGVGGISAVLDTASADGLLAGVLLSLLVFVFGGPVWFCMLLSFYAIGALSTKLRYEQKLERGIAEDNDGARGGANVLANSAIATIAVLAYAVLEAGLAAPIDGTVSSGLFVFAFGGALATALGDTLSSEIGGIFDEPRLITTFERVPPGTDGAITWQGELAGIGGAAIVAGIGLVGTSVGQLAAIDATGALIVIGGGIVGMTVDSLLGATVEGDRIGNEGVNFLATLAGALAGFLLGLLLVGPV